MNFLPWNPDSRYEREWHVYEIETTYVRYARDQWTRQDYLLRDMEAWLTDQTGSCVLYKASLFRVILLIDHQLDMVELLLRFGEYTEAFTYCGTDTRWTNPNYYIRIE